MPVNHIDAAIGDALTRFPNTDETCEDAICVLFRWARLLANTLPRDKRERAAYRAYHVADHLAAPKK